VSDSDVATKGVEVVRIEDVTDQPHLHVAVLLEAVVRDDPRRFLTTVLECVERVIERSGGVTVRKRDTDHTALFVHPYSPALLCHS
jgi:hypothetical protein